MKDFLAALKKSVADLRDRANAALSKFKPLDQAELSRETLYGVNSLEWSVERLEEIAGKIDEKEKALDGEIAAEVQKALDAKIAAGEFVTKSTADGAVAAARDEEKKLADARVSEAVAAARSILTRRSAIVTKHGEKVAAGISDDRLEGDDAAFAAFSTELDRRVKELSEIGITAAEKPLSFAIATASAFDEGGRKSFDTELARVKEIAGTSAAPGNRGTGAAAASAAGGIPGTGQPPAAGGAPQSQANPKAGLCAF